MTSVETELERAYYAMKAAEAVLRDAIAIGAPESTVAAFARVLETRRKANEAAQDAYMEHFTRGPDVVQEPEDDDDSTLPGTPPPAWHAQSAFQILRTEGADSPHWQPELHRMRYPNGRNNLPATPSQSR